MSLERIASAGGAVGADEWLALSDQLLAGLVHTLNNRVAALSACSELAALGDAQLLRDGVLAAEVERLRNLGSLLALLPARDRPAEALEVMPLLEDGMLLHAHHPRMPGIEGVVQCDGTTPAVRAPRWALARLVLLLIDAAKTAAHDARANRFELTLSGSEDVVRIRGRMPRTGMAYAAWLATLCDGTLIAEGDRAVLTLPSLQATRRREREARGGA